MINTCLAGLGLRLCGGSWALRVLLPCFWAFISHQTIKKKWTKIMNRYLVFPGNCSCNDLGGESILKRIKSSWANKTLSFMTVPWETWALPETGTRSSCSDDPCTFDEAFLNSDGTEGWFGGWEELWQPPPPTSATEFPSALPSPNHLGQGLPNV